MDDEFNAYAVEMLQASDTLIMGRTSYERMAGYWPTAVDNDPVVKEKMNGTPKLVFSRTLKKVAWQNSRLATGSIADEVARLKQVPGDGLLPNSVLSDEPLHLPPAVGQMSMHFDFSQSVVI